jgi:flagellar protein FlaJ
VVQDLLKDTATGSSGGVFSALKDMDLKQLDSILFNMAIVEAVFGGLAAGKIGSGSYVAGIKHIVVMVVIAIIAFNVM